MIQRILMANDHAGVQLKQALKTELKEQGYRVTDLGTNKEDPSVDYPLIAKKACTRFIKDRMYTFGILICGTGIGIAMAANKMHGIRCAAVYTPFMARMAKEHNHANFIALGAKVDITDPMVLVKAFIEAEDNEEDRHLRRVGQVMRLRHILPEGRKIF